jgi:hypothetical protein
MAKLAGHSDCSTTMNVYSHANWGKEVEAVESVEGVFVFNTMPWERRGEPQTDGRALTRREGLGQGRYEVNDDDDPDLDEEAKFLRRSDDVKE